MKPLALRASKSSAARSAGVSVNDWLNYDEGSKDEKQNTNNFFHINTSLDAVVHELICGDSNIVKTWYESLTDPSSTEQALGGWAYLNLNAPRSAVDALEKAIANGCPCHGLLAAACHQLTLDTLAINVLHDGRTVVENAPLEFQVFWYRENAEQVHRKSPQESLAFFNHALHLAFQDARTHPLIPGISVLKAAALARLGYDYDAFQVAKTALDFSPSPTRKIQLFYRMLISQLNLGSLKRASRIAEQLHYYENNLGNTLAAYALGRYYIAIEYHSEAKPYLLTATQSNDIEVVFYAHMYLTFIEMHTMAAFSAHLECARGILSQHPNERMQAHFLLQEAQFMVAQRRPDAPKFARIAIEAMVNTCPPNDTARAYAVLADALCIGNTHLPDTAIDALNRIEELRNNYYLGHVVHNSTLFINLAFEAMFNNVKPPSIVQKFLHWSNEHHWLATELTTQRWGKKHRNVLESMQEHMRQKNYSDLLTLYNSREKEPDLQRCAISELMDACAAIANCKLGRISTAIAIMKKPNRTGLKNSAMLEIIEAKAKLSQDEVSLLYMGQKLLSNENVAQLTLSVSSIVLSMVLQFSNSLNSDYKYVGANYQIGKESELFLLDTFTGEEHCVRVSNWDFNSFSDLVAFFA
jgi:tetratricopeptide (TPR) repeat protein